MDINKNISCVRYTKRNSMYIILDVCLRCSGAEGFVGYSGLEQLHIPGISFANVLYETVGVMSILPTIICNDVPINKFIISGAYDSKELPYIKDVFDYIKKELIPFADYHKNDFGLYLYSDLYFIPKKNSIKDFSPIGKFLEKKGLVGSEIDKSKDEIQSIIDAYKVNAPKVQSVDELIEEQAGRYTQPTNVNQQQPQRNQIPPQRTSQMQNLDYMSQQTQMQTPTQSHVQPQVQPIIPNTMDNPDAAHFGVQSQTSSPQMSYSQNMMQNMTQTMPQEKLYIDELIEALNGYINTTSVKLSGSQRSSGTAISRAWMFITYLQRLFQEVNTLQSSQCSVLDGAKINQMWTTLVNHMINLQLATSMYRTITKAPTNVAEFRNSIQAIYMNSLKSLIAEDVSNKLYTYGNFVKNYVQFNSIDSYRIVKNVDNDCVISIKSIARIVSMQNVEAAGDYSVLCSLYIMISTYLSSSYRNTLNLQKSMTDLRNAILKDNFTVAWSLMCQVLKEFYYL